MKMGACACDSAGAFGMAPGWLDQMFTTGVHSDLSVPGLYQIVNASTITSACYVINRFCLVGRISKGGMPVIGSMRWLICVTCAHMETWTRRLPLPV